uniref:Uncharacterized protein n=1 Tax=Romanomermis culicivorax TaxID=13658 RepID=A0A915KPQ7_ROMCU
MINNDNNGAESTVSFKMAAPNENQPLAPSFNKFVEEGGDKIAVDEKYDVNEAAGALDAWNLWSQVYSDRDMRLKLYCRDPEEKTPCVSNTLVVRNIHLDCSPTFFRDTYEFLKLAKSFISSFIKFKEVRDAVQACQFYNGYRLKGRILEVVHYDSAYKYNATEENVNGYVRQAYLQSESRASKVRLQPTPFGFPNTQPLPVYPDCQQFSTNRFGEEKNMPSAGSSYYNQQQQYRPYASQHIVRFSDSVVHIVDDNWRESKNDQMEQKQPQCPSALEAKFLQLPDINGALGESDDDENRTKKHIKCVDDVGLESEDGFLEWLRAKLNFTGPQHYTHPDIARAWHKLPPSVRRRSDWLLGFLRSSDGLIMVGPFVSLPEHTYWAKEMCVVAMLDYKSPFKEMWEPMHPTEISSDRQLTKYMKSLLTQFGPLSVADNKIQLLLRSLPEPMHADPTYSPDGLCRILERNPQFVVHKEIYYLFREHEHLLSSLMNVEKLINSQKMLCDKVALLSAITAATDVHQLSKTCLDEDADICDTCTTKGGTLNGGDIEDNIDGDAPSISVV